MTLRTLKDGPWTWANKAALNLIRNGCEQCDSALLVYYALCECASNASSEEFDTTPVFLAGLCGLTEKTVRMRLREIEALGLVEIQRNKAAGFNRPSTYSLLRCKKGATQYAAITSKAIEPDNEKHQ